MHAYECFNRRFWLSTREIFGTFVAQLYFACRNNVAKLASEFGEVEELQYRFVVGEMLAVLFHIFKRERIYFRLDHEKNAAYAVVQNPRFFTQANLRIPPASPPPPTVHTRTPKLS